MYTLALFGYPGWQELLVFAAIVLLLFSRRIPQTARSIGHGIVEFHRGLRGEAPPDNAEADHAEKHWRA